MKTAVNISDSVFREAERYARRVGTSRSRLYSDALAEYLRRHAPDPVTEQWNAMLESLSESDLEESRQLERAGAADLRRRGGWNDD